MSSPEISERRQLDLLARAFVARFADNDVMGPDVDLRQSLIWVIAALMTPGIMLSLNAAMKYGAMMRAVGPEGVARAAVLETTLLLGLGMAAMGMVTVVVWDSLLVDRRDCHVLGPLPVRLRTVLAAKALSLAYFWLVVTTAVNIASTLVFSLVVGGATSIPRTVLAHVVSLWLGSAFVFLSVLALQGTLVAVLGATSQRRASSVLQLVFTIALFFFFLLHPYFAVRVAMAVNGPAGSTLGWVAQVPLVWFVGLYEQVQGHAWPVLDGLAWRACWSTLLMATVSVVAYGAGYGRHVRRTLESRDVPKGARPGVVAWAKRSAARWRLEPPAACGLAGFVLATVARSTRHRLGLWLALGVGLAIAFTGMPRVLDPSLSRLARPSVELLSIPLILIFALTCGMKGLFKVPSELEARWIFEQSEPADGRWLAGARRAFVAVCVVPPIAVCVPACWWLWGTQVAMVHGLVCVTMGLVLVEIWMIAVTRVPFATAYMTGSGRLRMLWPVYIQGLFLFAFTSVQLELAFADRPAVIVGACAVLLVIVAALRHKHPARVGRRQLDTFDERPDSPQPLGLAHVSRG